MARWSQKDITEWAHQTFGEPELLSDVCDRTVDEMAEFCDVTMAQYTDLDKLVDEAADVVIMLSQVMSFIGVDLQQSVDDKMEINSMRSWIKTGAGIGRHQ